VSTTSDQMARKIVRSGVYDISTHTRTRWFASYTIENPTFGYAIPPPEDYWRVSNTKEEAQAWLQERLAGAATGALGAAQ
jgi:hypothetical protein